MRLPDAEEIQVRSVEDHDAHDEAFEKREWSAAKPLGRRRHRSRKQTRDPDSAATLQVHVNSCVEHALATASLR